MQFTFCKWLWYFCDVFGCVDTQSHEFHFHVTFSLHLNLPRAGDTVIRFWSVDSKLLYFIPGCAQSYQILSYDVDYPVFMVILPSFLLNLLSSISK